MEHYSIAIYLTEANVHICTYFDVCEKPIPPTNKRSHNFSNFFHRFISYLCCFMMKRTTDTMWLKWAKAILIIYFVVTRSYYREIGHLTWYEFKHEFQSSEMKPYLPSNVQMSNWLFLGFYWMINRAHIIHLDHGNYLIQSYWCYF